jgi:hypothetical protein
MYLKVRKFQKPFFLAFPKSKRNFFKNFCPSLSQEKLLLRFSDH